MSERVEFKTADGVNIVGDFYAAPDAKNDAKNAAVLLHMMPSTRESWQNFSKHFAAAGIAALAIDLRGHGESIAAEDGRRLDYRKFTDKEHQQSILDARAAAEYLKARGFTPVFLAGASIGANLALQFLAESKDARAAVLFSPGTDYRGIEAISLAGKLPPEKRVFVVAAKDDKNVSGAAEMASEIYERLSCERRLKIFETGGHGTDILDAHPEFMEESVRFFGER